MPDRVGEEGCVEGATTKCERLTAIADEQGWRPMADVSHPHTRRIAEMGAASGAMERWNAPPAGISAASALVRAHSMPPGGLTGGLRRGLPHWAQRFGPRRLRPTTEGGRGAHSTDLPGRASTGTFHWVLESRSGR